ncbi:hypothetical protein [Microbacterium mangrovi]|nr:hypothetical protein [Microbacterium mangrovi]
MTIAMRRGVTAIIVFAALLLVGVWVSVRVPPYAVGPGVVPDAAHVWSARILLVLTLAWIVIGIISARTSLVGRPGASAARASWIAASRPWRARESTLGMLQLDRVLLLVIPGGMLAVTRVLQSSAGSIAQLVVTFGGWVVFVVVAELWMRGRSPWALIAAVAGVVVLRCTLTLLPLSFGFPYGEAVTRIYMALSTAGFLWTFVAAAWSLFPRFGPRRGIGIVMAAAGAGLTVTCAVIALIGPAQVLEGWIDHVSPLPWGLGRMIGIANLLGSVTTAVWSLALSGLVVGLVGVVLALPERTRTAL